MLHTHTERILSLSVLWMTVPAVHYPPSLLGEGGGGKGLRGFLNNVVVFF